LERVRIPVREPAPAERVDGVDLVHYELDGQLVGADLPQHRVDGGDLLHKLLLRRRAVDDMENEIGDERLLERRGEALHQLVRQAADEADSVGDEVAPSLLLEAAGRWIERLEQPVRTGAPRVGECIEECRLPGVRVPGERDGRRLRATPLLAANVALAAQLPQPLAQERDPAARKPPVRLELRFAWAAGPDSG